jgi:3-phenylpropionate/trans-cinnamate dioxygenase ferredoxin subunit
MGWSTICRLADLGHAKPLGVEVGDVPVCVVRLAERVFAVRDECTHEAVPLSEGDVEGTTIECWAHGSRFDLRTGEVLNPPAVENVATYPTRIDGDDVQVNIG